jgi:tetratricopeptide (TPR) repeat protein
VDRVQDLLQSLKEARGDPRAQAALTAEFLILARPQPQQEPLRAALDAAAVLHWFDPELLRKVLSKPLEEAQFWCRTLAEHSFVERYRGESDLHFNLHETTRLGWRVRFARGRAKQFRDLSLRASSCFTDDPMPRSRIEWIYHLLCGDPELAATELEKLDREWSGNARSEDRSALAAVLQELAETNLVEGRARARSLLVIAWSRADWEAAARLAKLAEEALMLAEKAGDESSIAEAWALEGHVSHAQGRLEAALAPFEQRPTISRRLAEQTPGNTRWQRGLAEETPRSTGWQRGLAIAHSRVGDVLQAQGRLEAAQAAFEQTLSIFLRLAHRDPTNTGWQRELAAAHSRVGDVLQAQGRLEVAQAAFEQALLVNGRLAEQNPSDAGCHRDLAVTHSQVGDVLQAQGRLAAAQEALERCLTISQRLAEQDPGNAGRQRELAVAHSRVGDILQAQGRLEAALAAFEQDLAIIGQLAEVDPSNAGWQQDLATAHNRVGDVLEAQGRLEAARAAFEECLAIARRLAEQDPSNAGWQRDVAVAHNRVGGVLEAQGRLAEAQAAFEHTLTIFLRLAEQDPNNAGWQRDLAVAQSRIVGSAGPAG